MGNLHDESETDGMILHIIFPAAVMMTVLGLVIRCFLSAVCAVRVAPTSRPSPDCRVHGEAGS